MTNVEDRDGPVGADPEEGWGDGSGEALEASIEHADRARGAESFGTTADEQERGESLDRRLAEEGPDGRSAQTDLGLSEEDVPDEEPDLVAESVVGRDRFVAPEDAAMSVRDDLPGVVDHPDDYVDGEDRDQPG